MISRKRPDAGFAEKRTHNRENKSEELQTKNSEISSLKREEQTSQNNSLNLLNLFSQLYFALLPEPPSPRKVVSSNALHQTPSQGRAGRTASRCRCAGRLGTTRSRAARARPKPPEYTRSPSFVRLTMEARTVHVCALCVCVYALPACDGCFCVFFVESRGTGGVLPRDWGVF